MLKKAVQLGAVTMLSLVVAGCATERSQSVAVPAVAAASKPYQGVRSPISVGKFDNRTNYLRGVFSDGVDRLGGQAKTILVSHLQRSGRFQVMDRENLSEIAQEAAFNKKASQIKGARYVVTGDVTAFGRKVTGDQQLFGILGRGKEQVAYAKVDLNVVDVTTSEVVYSASGAGEYSLSNREVIGFGGTAGYDSTLNGKVLDTPVVNATLADRIALMQAGLLDQVTAWANDPATDPLHRLAFQTAGQFSEDSPALAAGAVALGLNAEQLSGLFLNASKIKG